MNTKMAIYKRDKTWWVRYTHNGKLVRQSLQTQDKRVAKYREAKLLTKKIEGSLPAAFKNVQFKDAIDDYIENALITKENKTACLYRTRLLAFFNWTKIKDLGKIEQKNVQDYLMYRVKKGISFRTANNILGDIKIFLNWAIRLKYITENPAQHIKKFRVEKNPPKFIELANIEILLAASKASHLYPMVATALYTGMRLGELMRLEWNDIDFDKATLTVENKIYKSTKNKKFRVIPLNKKLENILRRYKKDTGRCFLNSLGLPYESDPKKEFKRITIESGLKLPIGWHTLRHTFASHLIMSGVDIVTVSRLLGHSNISTTMIYAHLAQKHIETAIQKLPF